MGFQINTNLDAFTALLNLNTINTGLSQSIQRLSSGLRINTPADDPAGFVIANSLQVQVDGLNEVIANNQNSINLVKTATGALGEISTLLRDIHANALDAAANASLDPAAAQADQLAIQSAIQTISSIAASTQFGDRALLDGSAGTAATVTNTTLIGGLSIGGSYGGGVTQSGNVTITVNNAATYAQAQGSTATYASVNATIATVSGGTTGNGGTVTINGQSVAVTGSDTVQTLLNKINNLAGTTGVSAAFSSANGSGYIVLTQQTYGANYKITESESAALILGIGGTTVAGLNATVTVTAPTLVSGQATSAVVTFVGGRSSTDSGLRVTDVYGNSLLLTNAGNTTGTSNAAVGVIASNPTQFQIGTNAGQTASISLPNVTPSRLGVTSVSGQNLATIDVSTAAGASQALTVINEAISQVAQYAAQLGGFQKNVLDTTNNYLSVAMENLSASVSSIRDVNVAQEATRYANLQVLQQAGVSILRTAQSLPSIYLRLLS